MHVFHGKFQIVFASATILLLSFMTSTAFADMYAVVQPAGESGITVEEVDQMVAKADQLITQPTGKDVPYEERKDSNGNSPSQFPHLRSELIEMLARSGASDARERIDATRSEHVFVEPDLSSPHIKGTLRVQINENMTIEQINEVLAGIPGLEGAEISYEKLIFGWTTITFSEQTDLKEAIKALSEHPDAFEDATLNRLYASIGDDEPLKSEYSQSEFDFEPARPDEEQILSDMKSTIQSSLNNQSQFPPYGREINDPDVDWGIDAVFAREAWNECRTSKSVTVAVIDTGCNAAHPDLVNNIVASYDATGLWGNGVDADLPTGNTSGGHGTHVCGIISAEADNGIGSAGVSYNAGLLPVTACNERIKFDMDDISAAVVYIISTARQYNTRVVNFSLGGVTNGMNTEDNQYRIILESLLAANIIPVCAGGNDYDEYWHSYLEHPANVNTGGLNVISLYNNTHSGLTRAYYSNCNGVAPTLPPGISVLDISAPGSSITSSNAFFSSGTYSDLTCEKSGTSMAAPYVSGVCALVSAANPNLNAAEVKSVVLRTATDLIYETIEPTGHLYGLLEPVSADYGFDDQTGAGCVNAWAAVRAARGMPAPGGLDLSQGSISYSGPWSLIKHIDDVTTSVNCSYPDKSTPHDKIIVRDANGRRLNLGSDFDIEYINASNPGTASVKVTGKGFYSGILWSTYTINKIRLRPEMFTIMQPEYEFRGSNVNSQPPIAIHRNYFPKEWNSDELIIDPVYVDEAGPQTLIIRSSSESQTIEGEVWLNFDIVKSDIADFIPKDFCSKTYSGEAQQIVLSNDALENQTNINGHVTIGGADTKSSKLVEGIDYDIVYENNVNAGTATAIFVGKGGFYGQAVRTFTIEPKKLVWDSDIKDQIYNGGNVTPTTTWTSCGQTLSSGKGVKFTYANNTSVGTATVTATSTNPNFMIITGPKTFKIMPYTLNWSSSVADQTYTGKAITPTVSWTPFGKKISSSNGIKFTYKNNVNAGTATVTAISTDPNFKVINGTKTFKIKPRNLVWSSSVRDYTYTGKAIKPTRYWDTCGRRISSGNGVKFTYKNNVNAGTATVTAISTNPNFRIVNGTKTFKIKPYRLNWSIPVKDQVYTGRAIKPMVYWKNVCGQRLSSGHGLKFTYKNNVKVGTAVVTMTSTNKNFVVVNGTKKFKIVKK